MFIMNDRAESQKLAFEVLRDVSEDILDEEDIDDLLGLLPEDKLLTAGEPGVERAPTWPAIRGLEYKYYLI